VPHAHLARGRWGEDRAASWYRDHGYRVVARNWRCPTGEIDLIVARDRLVVICEVKARRTAAYGPAASAVHRQKQQRLRRLAAEWLRTTGTRGVDVRFDVVAITGGDVTVIPGAF
jgi:putative endonuclease